MKSNNLKLLQQTFDTVNMWLHFAEAKNAALIAFNIALFAALMNSGLQTFSIVLYSGITVGLLCSTVLSLWSFKPINKSLENIASGNVNINLQHYAYIASLNPDEYLLKLYQTYWNDDIQDASLFPQIEKDLSEEIIQNSRIILRKQKCFEKAFYLDIAMILLICFLIICA